MTTIQARSTKGSTTTTLVRTCTSIPGTYNTKQGKQSFIYLLHRSYLFCTQYQKQVALLLYAIFRPSIYWRLVIVAGPSITTLQAVLLITMYDQGRLVLSQKLITKFTTKISVGQTATFSNDFYYRMMYVCTMYLYLGYSWSRLQSHIQRRLRWLDSAIKVICSTRTGCTYDYCGNISLATTRPNSFVVTTKNQL